jgi:hypothetical protein
MDAQQLLSRRFNEAYLKLGQRKLDLTEQNKVGSLIGTGLEGGFGQDNQARINYEAENYKQGLQDQYKTQSEILAEEKKAQDEAKRNAKIGGVIKGVTGLAGGAAKFFGPVGGLVGGAITNAGSGVASLFTGQDPDFNFDFIDNWNSYRNQKV